MLEFGSEEADLSALVSGDNRKTCGAAAGIDFEAQRLFVFGRGLPKDQGEGKPPPYGGFALFEQMPRSSRMARHQGLFVVVQDQDSVL